MRLTKSLYVSLLPFFCLTACGETQPKQSVLSSEDSITSEEGGLPLWEETDCFSYHFSNQSKDTMPIGAWCSPVGDYITDAQYALLKESGLNAIYGLYETWTGNSNQVIQSMGCAAKQGISYLVRDQEVVLTADDGAEAFQTRMEHYANRDSFAGVLCRDEPGMNSFDILAKARKMFTRYYPDALFYVNLFPNYASSVQLENANTAEPTREVTYEEYVDTYLAKVQPDMISYDYYPFNNKHQIADSYFENLSLIAKKAHQYKIPFWPFIQADEFGGSSRIPTKQEMMWQVNTSLLFGAKGIQYFCYFTPTEFSAKGYGGNFISATGQKTEIYDYAKGINAQIACMDEALMRSTLVAKMMYGASAAKLPESEVEAMLTSWRELKSVSTNDDLLIGCFDSDGKSLLFVMNNSLEDKADATLNFTTEIEANLYRTTKEEIKGTSYALSLEAGDAALIEITNYQKGRR